jgi:TRAP transporter TAXI family solute receptor
MNGENGMQIDKKLLVGAFVLATFVMGSAIVQSAEKPNQITILSGGQGGSWYGMGGGLAKIFIDNGVKSSAEVGGGISNVALVGAGKGELGFSMSIVPRMGELGKAPFKSKVTNVRAIAQLSGNMIHIVVSEKSGINSIAGLKGKKFATQPVGNVTTEAFKAVLATKGLSESDLNLSRGGQSYGAKEMKDRRLVGFTATTSPPSPAFADVSQSLDVKFLSLDENTFAALKMENPGFVRAEIAAGTYRGQDKPIITAATAMIIIVNEAMPDAQVEWITKTLGNNVGKMQKIHKAWRKISVKSMSEVNGIALHPGAVKYYKSVGVM